MTDNNRPKVGLALRGASSRSVFYIGFLEVLSENNFPIDYIATMSSGSIVTAAFACGTLEKLKKQAFDFNASFLYSIIRRSETGAGVYSMKRIEELLRVYTKNKKFEDVKPAMGFVCVDIEKGQEIVLSMGDIAKSVCATCTLPWVFEPMKWGNMELVDGGLMNVIPGNVCRQAGTDLVIGVDLRTKNLIFGPTHQFFRRIIQITKKILLIDKAEQLGNWLEERLRNSNLFEFYEETKDFNKHNTGMFGVLLRCMEIYDQVKEKHKENSDYQCDLIIVPELPKPNWWKRVLKLRMLDFNNSVKLYEIGRKTAIEQLPSLWQLLAEKEAQMSKQDKLIKQLLKE